MEELFKQYAGYVGLLLKAIAAIVITIGALEAVTAPKRQFKRQPKELATNLKGNQLGART